MDSDTILQENISKLSWPPTILKFSLPEQMNLKEAELWHQGDFYELKISYCYCNITEDDLSSNRKMCISTQKEMFRADDYAIVDYVQELLNDSDSVVSKFIASHQAFQDYRKKLEEDKRREAILTQKKEAHFFEESPMSISSAIVSRVLDHPITGKVKDVSEINIQSVKGKEMEYRFIILQDLDDSKFRIRVKSLSSLISDVSVGDIIVIKAESVYGSTKQNKLLLLEKLKIFDKKTDLWNVLRTRILDKYKKLGKPELFTNVLELECKDPKIEKLLCPTGHHDLRTRQARPKKILHLCESKHPNDNGFLIRISDRPLIFQWYHNS